EAFAQAQAAAERGTYEEDLPEMEKGIIERRMDLVFDDEDYVEKMGQMTEYSSLGATHKGPLTAEEKKGIETLKNALAFIEKSSNELEGISGNPIRLASLVAKMKLINDKIKGLNPQQLSPSEAKDLLLVPKALNQL